MMMAQCFSSISMPDAYSWQPSPLSLCVSVCINQPVSFLLKAVIEFANCYFVLYLLFLTSTGVSIHRNMETPNKVEDLRARILRPPATVVPTGMYV